LDFEIRPAAGRDFPAIARLQAESFAAAQYSVDDYPTLAAVHEGEIIGFASWRQVASGEFELLSLATDVRFRRKGIARALVEAVLKQCGGAVFLEVRESNAAARNLYHSMGFHQLGARSGYYNDPPERAIVMKFHSC
jgi:ribosomal-protein-alanine N-acetyltransferase